VWVAEAEKLFLMLRCGYMDDVLKRKILKGYVDTRLEGLATGEFAPKLQLKDIHLMMGKKMSAREEAGLYSQRFHDMAGLITDDLLRKDTTQHQDEFAEVFQGHEIPADEKEINELCLEFMRTKRMLYRVGAGRIKEERDFQAEEELKNFLGVQQVQAEEAPKKCKLLDELIEEYINYKVSREEWGSKNTIRDKRLQLRYITKVLEHVMNGPVNVYDIQRKDALTFADTVRKLPDRMGIKAKYKGKTIGECIKIADSEGDERLHVATVNKYGECVKEMVNWAKQNVDHDLINHFQNLRFKDSRLESEKTEPLDEKDIEMFYKGLARYCYDRDIQKQHFYWIPLIGLYSGMRLNEICQLWVDDIIEVNGVTVFRITEDEERNQRTKNVQSIRGVPVHNTLKELGFMEYVDAIRAKGFNQLWPSLRPDKETGSYSDNFSTKYSQKKKKFTDADKKIIFHSTRATITTQLHLVGIDDKTITDLIGHAHKSTLRRSYLAREKISTLQEALNKLDYGVDIGLLKPKR